MNDSQHDTAGAIIFGLGALAVVAAITVLLTGCELPLNGTGPADPLETHDARDDAGQTASDDAASPETTKPGAVDAAMCLRPPATDYALSAPKGCDAAPGYWSTVNFYLESSRGCALSAVPDACVCDYSCNCMAANPVAQPCTCTQATPGAIIVMDCPTL